jgi:tetratricopeptide (TPR) repeat protein
VTQHPDFGLARDIYTFAPEALGEALPLFEIVREIGKGSMGIVYEARRRSDGQRLALKVLPPSLTLSERTIARFLREGRLMARVEHPDIVRFLGQGSGTAGGVRLFWFAMELIDGSSLQERFCIGPLPVRTACAIAARTGRALQFAHERGVVHRDMKPSNILLRAESDGSSSESPPVAISDFGLARETGTGSMTESGALVGTPMYMAPELVLNGSAQAGTLADVYGLGATLYTLLSGQPPFDGPTAQSVLRDVLDREPPRLRRLRADLPQPVEAIVRKAMSKEPRNRYGSALELSLDLERYLRGERVLARAPGPVATTLRAIRRRPLLAATALLAVLFGLGTLYLLHERHHGLIEQGIAEAENWLAQASSSRDERDRPLSESKRRELLLAALSAATDVLARDAAVPMAHVVRAKAHYRLRQLEEALLDIDAAERLSGGPQPELLHFRIDVLRQRADPASTRRLQEDLTTLLQLDRGSRTRAMVAEHLLEIGLQASQAEREAALSAAYQVLEPIGDDNARTAVLRARLLEAEGLTNDALEAMRAARRHFQGDVYVHLQAAAMFDRLGLAAEGRAEKETASILQPTNSSTSTAPVDLQGIGDFLGEVNRLLQALDPPPEGEPAATGKTDKQRD